jgi:hypothetical protein
MTAAELKVRQSCRHKGEAWLRERGKKAGRRSAQERLRKIAREVEGKTGSRSRAFILGYERGYRAAYKRHYDYWRKRSWWERGPRPLAETGDVSR